MENVIKGVSGAIGEVRTKTYSVNEEGFEFILLINSDAYYGDLDMLREEIARHVDDGGDISDCFIGTYNSLKGVEIKDENKIEVTMSDNEYSEDEETYIITRNGREIDEFSYEDDALERLAELIAEEDGREDLFNLERKVHYTCTYDIESEREIKITIPPQTKEIEVEKAELNYEEMNVDDLFALRSKINDILGKKLADHNQ